MAAKPLKEVRYLAVHCSATQPLAKINAKEIDRWHRQRGFLKIGYHFVIKTDGTVETGRSLEEAGAHVEGYNSQSVGICLVGGINKQGKSEANFTEAQYVALAELLGDLLKRYPKAEIRGHRDFPNVAKDCPCFDVKQWWHETVVDPQV